MRAACAVVVGGLLLFANAASAATRYVDDDHAQCGRARFATIQAAVDASSAGDVVRVCGGTYAEQVVVPADKAGLQLKSLPLGGPHAALIIPPPTGLVADPDTPRASSLVHIEADRVKFVGFHLSGPVSPPDPGPGCLFLAGVRMRLVSHVYVDRNHIDKMSGACGFIKRGISTEIADAEIDRNVLEGDRGVVEGFGARAIVAQHGRVNIHRNHVIGLSDAIEVHNAVQARVANNELEDTNGWAILTERSLVKVTGNRVRGSGAGIEIAEGSRGLVSGNDFSHGANGIIEERLDNLSPQVVHQPISMTIRANRTLDNRFYGIVINLSELPAPNFISDNVSRGNGLLDCLDENFGSTDPLVDPSFYHWGHNIGPTAEPRSICHPH